MALAGTAKDAVVAGVMVLADFGFSADDAGFAFGFGVGASAQGAVDEGFDRGRIAQDAAEVFGSLEALAGIFGERFEDDGREGSGYLWIELAWIGRGLFDVCFVNGEGVALEGEAVGEDFKHTDAEGVDIGLCGSFAAEEDLGCDVIGGADVGAFEGESSAARDQGEAKVDQFDLTVTGDEDVGGFEIAVQDALAVGVCESIEGLSKDRNGGLGAESLATPKHGVDVAPVDELHHHKQAISFVEEIVQGDEVGVIQSGHRTGFLDEALAKTGIAFEIRR